MTIKYVYVHLSLKNNRFVATLNTMHLFKRVINSVSSTREKPYKRKHSMLLELVYNNNFKHLPFLISFNKYHYKYNLNDVIKNNCNGSSN